MPGTPPKTAAPRPVQVQDSAAITGMMAEQTRQALVLSSMQGDMGQIAISLARMELILQGVTDDQGSLGRIVRGEDGKNSLIYRMVVVEQGYAKMSEHWDRIDKHLGSIEENIEERTEERSRQSQQIWIAVATAAVALLANAGTAIVTLLKH